MGFSARQQQCLEAMGVVPWVTKSAHQLPETTSVLSDSAVTANEPVKVQVPATDGSFGAQDKAACDVSACTSMPESVEQLSLWLPSQPVKLLTVRSEQRSFVGQAEAPLLIIADSTHSAGSAEVPATQAFDMKAAQLFDLMMRAINVPLQQRKLCCLSDTIETAGTTQGARVADLCIAQTQALLLLVQDWNSLTTPVMDHFRLDQPSLPVWRIPHPNTLLEFNQLKRQAWKSLQALQAVLCL